MRMMTELLFDIQSFLVKTSLLYVNFSSDSVKSSRLKCLADFDWFLWDYRLIVPREDQKHSAQDKMCFEKKKIVFEWKDFALWLQTYEYIIYKIYPKWLSSNGGPFYIILSFCKYKVLKATIKSKNLKFLPFFYLKEGIFQSQSWVF